MFRDDGFLAPSEIVLLMLIREISPIEGALILLGQHRKADLLLVHQSYLCLKQYLLSSMNVLLERMVLASWKLKDEKNIKRFVFSYYSVIDRSTHQQTQKERQTQLTNQQTDEQTDRDRKNKLIFCEIWTKVNLTICKKITKLTKLQLLHNFVIDTHQLVWVAVVEIEAPAASHEYEVGFL